MKNKKEIKDFVKKWYSQAATGESCCGPCLGVSFAKLMGYTEEELQSLPKSVTDAVFGCGNPTALAELKKGESVLDLGSGGGIDVFLAAKKVGTRGKVIGIDMTDEMIKLAKENAKGVGAKNVEFLLGEIEKIPVQDEAVDVIISNCVINLSPDKDAVFKEAFRVLKPGGRMLISDIVADGKLPEHIRKSLELWAGCVAGALEEKEYLRKIGNAGFEKVEVLSKTVFANNIASIKVRGFKPFN
jgi:ubiquinone/menaquinone biosynthesis C-methylase UbiE